MVAKTSTAQAAKRKKTEDMVDSPPKRVTRARTARTAGDDQPTIIKPAKTTKAPPKAAIEKKKAPLKPAVSQKKATAATKQAKRKAQTEDEDEPLIEEIANDAAEVEDVPPKPVAARSGRKKAANAPDTDETVAVDASKPRGRQTKASVNEKPKAAATSTRGRPKKAANVAIPTETATTGPEEAVESEEVVVPVKKATRGRAAAAVTKVTKVTKTKATTKATTTKKVQFEEDMDKENVPVEIEGPKKSALKPTGVRAKPVRKPAATRTTRGRKAANNEECKEEMQLPLSPKKVQQVAKAGSASSEDELAGEKTPIKSPHKSPSKFQVSPVRVMNIAVGASESAAPTSPSRSSPVHRLASPARRPPASPMKGGLSMSPRKIDINFSPEKPVFQANLKTPAKSSLLQESPRKGRLQNSVARPTLLSSQTPMKGSLLQSPARRPMTSPFKSQMKPTVPNSSQKVSPVRLPSPPKPLRFSPQQASSSPLRAAKSPDRTIPVFTTTPSSPETESISHARAELASDDPSKENLDHIAAATADNVLDKDDITEEVGQVESDDGPAPDKASFSSGFAFVTDDMRRVSMESGSTDELASPEKAYAPTPLRRNGISSRDFATPSTAARTATMEGPSADGVSFTPLMGKLNGWAASSPNKEGQTKLSRQARGVFSFGQPLGLNPSEQELPASVSGTPLKSSFFEDEMAVMDEELGEEATETGFEIVANSTLR